MEKAVGISNRVTRKAQTTGHLQALAPLRCFSIELVMVYTVKCVHLSGKYQSHKDQFVGERGGFNLGLYVA